jgi:PI31 proteasome regulator N-terminal
MAINPLSTESILKHMADALPTHVKGDTGSDFSSSYEAIALFAHACMAAVGFRHPASSSLPLLTTIQKPNSQK